MEATKFTEVGFHGRDVDQIIRDLVEASIALTRKRKAEAFRAEAARAAETRILDTLTGLNAAQRRPFREGRLLLPDRRCCGRAASCQVEDRQTRVHRRGRGWFLFR